MIRSILLSIVMFVLTSCAADRYEWNLAHTYVTPWTHLPRSDYEQIVRVVSYADQDPIIALTQHRRQKDGSTITAITGNVNATTYRRWHGYYLAKQDGVWRITFHGEASHTI